MDEQTPTSGSPAHPYAEAHLQGALAHLWRAMTDHDPFERRFRRRGNDDCYVEFCGRMLDDESDEFWLMREGDLYWLMSNVRFPYHVERFWEVDEIGPDDPGGWGY